MYKHNKNWRHTHPEGWNAQKKAYYARAKGDDVNGKRKWTQEEIDLIMRHDISDRELTKTLGRSMQAIQVKRSKWSKRYGQADAVNRRDSC